MKSLQPHLSLVKPIGITCCLVLGTSCTGQLPGSFRLAQQLETFSSNQEVNTKIDLLWIVDNSASMDVNQAKLRNGFQSFADRYLQPTWDIRIAVITTDTYMAHSTFTNYLGTVIPNTAGWQSPYIASRGAFTNPTSSPNLVNSTTLTFDSGVTFGDLVPAWGTSYARLLPGYHDGPVAALCFELLPYFLSGMPDCGIRDLPGAPTGPDSCIAPGAGESSASQCVNTVQNNTVRSGSAILTTLPPTGVAADASWTRALAENFMVNVSTGSAGQGSERGLGSVTQLIADNESSDTAFFRPDSVRGLIFISDEDDQTLTLPNPVPAGYKPQTDYKCDQAGLGALNPAANITGVNGVCCSSGGNNCTYGALGTSCPSKTVDAFTYTTGVCPDETKLVAVSEIKAQLDSFFLALDGKTEGDANYFVVSIVALTGQAIQDLQAARLVEDANVGALKVFAVDRGDRYLELGSLVGGNSLSLNIAESDYTEVLESIGRAIVDTKSRFILERAPTGQEDMIVTILHADGTSTEIAEHNYRIEAKSLIITNDDLVLSLQATDQISIDYQPKSLN